jgi:hypothetical protein
VRDLQHTPPSTAPGRSSALRGHATRRCERRAWLGRLGCSRLFSERRASLCRADRQRRLSTALRRSAALSFTVVVGALLQCNTPFTFEPLKFGQFWLFFAGNMIPVQIMVQPSALCALDPSTYRLPSRCLLSAVGCRLSSVVCRLSSVVCLLSTVCCRLSAGCSAAHPEVDGSRPASAVLCVYADRGLFCMPKLRLMKCTHTALFTQVRRTRRMRATPLTLARPGLIGHPDPIPILVLLALCTLTLRRWASFRCSKSFWSLGMWPLMERPSLTTHSPNSARHPQSTLAVLPRTL